MGDGLLMKWRAARWIVLEEEIVAALECLGKKPTELECPSELRPGFGFRMKVPMRFISSHK